jgi:hypothetical protein
LGYIRGREGRGDTPTGDREGVWGVFRGGVKKKPPGKRWGEWGYIPYIQINFVPQVEKLST